MAIAPEIESFYSNWREATRLEEDFFPLEKARTQELILRYLAPAPAKVLDVGGAAGAYALWLAALGYEVHLVDPVPLHVAQAGQASNAQPGRPLASIRVGDARSLERPDASADAVLLLGPLYHLTSREDRLAALGEARRVLRAGGVLFAAAISRFASLIDGMRGPFFDDPQFERIVHADLRDGQHRNDTGRVEYFTTAFFHKPEELAAEVREAGFDLVATLAIEGPCALLPDFARRWGDPRSREQILAALRVVESEPSLIGVSPHMLAVARR